MTAAPAPKDPVVPAGRWARALAGEKEPLQDLARSYWYCVYAWWRRAGLEPARAETATLASWTRWLSTEPPTLDQAHADRLREWLPARLAEQAEHGVKLMTTAAVQIDAAWAERRFADEPAGEANAILQRRWALTVLEFAVAALKAEYEARGEAALFAEVLPFAGFGQSGEEAYAEAAGRTGKSTSAMRKAVFDFRTRQRELLRALAADTVANPGDLESEMTALLLACDAAGPGSGSAPLPSLLQAIPPDQMLARAMASVKMSTAGAHGWEPPTPAEVARLFPNYTDFEMLGRGGMGAVYKACQTSLDRCVAIKLLPLEISVDRDFADRFRREARAMAKLNHPNIISVFDFGQTSEGHLYFVMEFVDGAMLHDLIHKADPLPPGEALGLIEQVCDALAYAHGKGIVHRDVKPSNVMVEREGRVKVADFGLARLTDAASAEQWGTTMTGIVMGTPDYMSPEQKRGSHVDQRADIYALGVMLYEALCRETPQGAFEMPSKRCGLDKRLDAIISKSLAQQADARFQSTTEMKAAIETVRPAVAKAYAKKSPPKPAPKPASAPPPGPSLASSVTKLSSTSRAPWWIGAAVVVAVLAVGTLFIAPKLVRHDAPPSAQTPAPRVAAGPDWSKAVDSVVPLDTPIITGTNTGAPALASMNDGRWVDGLANIRRALEASLRTSAGGGIQLRNPDGGAPPDRIVGFAPGVFRDVAVRMSYRWDSGSGVELCIRVKPGESYDSSGYFVTERSNPAGFALSKRVSDRTHRDLAQAPSPKDLSATGERVLEFRALGHELTVWVNGVKILHASDADATLGTMQLKLTPGLLIDKLEYCDLSTGETPPANALPADPRKGDAGVNQAWQNALKTEFSGAVKDPLRERNADGLLLLSPHYWIFQRGPQRDGAVRVRFPFHLASVPILTCRINGNDHYQTTIQSGRAITLDRRVGERYEPISPATPLATALQEGDNFEMELRAVGSHLTVRVNGQQIIEAEDRLLTAGRVGLWFKMNSPQQIRALEYLDLDAASSPAASAATSPTANAAKAAPFVNSLGMRFVPVPITGGPTKDQRVLFGIWDVRVQDYAAFATETKREWPKPDFQQGPTHPAVLVNWEDATAFCAWLTERERKAGTLAANERYRLPTDHEWSCAAGLGDREDPAKTPAEKDQKVKGVFPWGDQWPPPTGVGNLLAIEGYDDGFANTAPVGSFPANQFGLYDISGNVWQLCEDWFDGDALDRVMRGGSFTNFSGRHLLSSFRDHHPSSMRLVDHGFRIVLAPVSGIVPPAAVAITVTPAAATKDAPFANSLGMKFVPVPILGGPMGGERVLFSIWETRVQDYKAFNDETKHGWEKPGFEQGPTHPAVEVSWNDARAFCEWLTKRELEAGKIGTDWRYRLPTDHEWSCAVGLGERENPTLLPSEKTEKIGDEFPWGKTWPPTSKVGNYAGEELSALVAKGGIPGLSKVLGGHHDGFANTAPVGSFAANQWGLYDLGGNAWEWCEDWFDSAQKDHLVRGASWRNGEREYLLSSRRVRNLASFKDSNIGFRIVLAPEGAK